MINRLVVFAALSIIVWLLSPVCEATALNVPPTARVTAENVKVDAKVIADRARDEERAEKEFNEIVAAVTRLEEDKLTKEMAAEQAETMALQAESAAEATGANKPAAQSELAAAKAALEKAEINARRTNTALSIAQAAEAEAARIYAFAAENPSSSVAVVARMQAKYNAAAEIMFRAERQAEAAEKAIEAAEERIAAAEKHLDAIAEAKEIARDAASDARAVANEAQDELKDIESDLAYARTNLTAAKAVLIEVKKTPNLADRMWRYWGTDIKYYSWQDNQGHSGNQLYQPYNFGYVYKNMEYHLHTGYVLSNNRSFVDGRVSTLTDTNLGFAYTKQYKKYTSVYNLNINMPTGKSALRGSNAIMSDDLVEFSRFGEGWNFTPGINVSWKIGKEDTWTIGTYYSLNGSYTIDKSIADGRVDPGNGWSKVLRWQHAGQKWQFVGELLHTDFSSSKDGNTNYTQGDQIEMHLTYNKVLQKDRNLMFYYWHSIERPYSSRDPLIATGTTTTTNYWGSMWSKALTEKQTFRITSDFMHRSGNIYNPLTTLTSSGRTKYTYGLGYDYKFTPEKKLSIDIERLYMKDDAPANTKYQGYNFYIRYLAYM